MACGSGTPIAVFASGRGSNFRALCEAARAGKLAARVVALVTNVHDAGACGVAREFGVPAFEVPNAGLSRQRHEEELLCALAETKVEWIVLAGYMRLFSETFIKRFYDDKIGAARIVNIHPSLLPAFAGVDGYGQALRYGVKQTGASVHLVGAGLDDGPIVAQRPIEVRDDDTLESLSARGLVVEHALYVETLQRLLCAPWQVSSGGVADGRPRVVFQ